jgi:hypothetical protein
MSLWCFSYESWTGVGTYQGPVFVDNCYFDRYSHLYWAPEWARLYGVTPPVLPGAAISFHRQNLYPTTPWCLFSNIKFGYCDDVSLW